MAIRRPLVVVNGVTSELPSGDTTPTNSVAPGAARQLLQTNAGGTATEWTSNVDIPGTLDVTSTATFDSIAQYPLGSAGAPTLTFTGDNNTGIYSPGADQVAISTSGSGRLFVNSSGNIGVASSSVQSLGANYSTLEIKGKSGGFGGGIILSPSDAATVPAVWYYDGLCNFGSLNSTPLSFLTNGTEKLHITSAGLVGVGTSSPAYNAHITNSGAAGTLSLHGSSGIGYLLMGNIDTSSGPVVISSANQVLAISRGNSFSSAGGGTLTESVRIDSSGRVGIGTTQLYGILTARAATNCNFHIRTPSDVGSSGEGVAIDSLSDNAGGVRPLVMRATSHVFFGESTERLRIDSSGRLLVGTSSARTNFFNTVAGTQLQVEGTTYQSSSLSLVATGNNSYDAGTLVLGKGRGNAVGSNTIVQNGTPADILGYISFQGNDGSEFVEGASIKAEVDGGVGANDLPSRLVFSTTADGASSPTERMRITNDGVQAYNQPAPAAVNATATLTVADLKAGIITSTSAAATDMTLPTGTDTQAGFSGTYDNFTFEWSVINTGPSLVRVLAATAHTIVGSGSVATGTSGRFASRRTAANTFVTYRLS